MADSLSLLPFLASSSTPSAILDRAPLQSALLTRRSLSPLQTPRWRAAAASGTIGGGSGLTPAIDSFERLGVVTPGSSRPLLPPTPRAGGGATGQRSASGPEDYFSPRTSSSSVDDRMRELAADALVCSFANDAFLALTPASTSGGAATGAGGDYYGFSGGLQGGIGRSWFSPDATTATTARNHRLPNQVRSSKSPEAVLDEAMEAVSPESVLDSTPTTDALSFLSSEDRFDLFIFLLDLLDSSTPSAPSSPAANPETPAPLPPTAVQLTTREFTATFVGNSHIVLTLPSSTPLTAFATTARALRSPPPEHSPSMDVDYVRGGGADDDYLAFLGQTMMGRMIREYDWASTSIGPISSWCAELKTQVSSILSSPFRESILWGDEHIMLYNDGYVHAAGGKHPRLLGKPAVIGWEEIWEELDPIAKRVYEGGETIHFVDHFLPMARGGMIEETYHTFSYSPFRDVNGAILGFRNFSYETTASVIAARRVDTVRDLIAATSLARNVSDFSRFALESLSSNAFDLPFVLLYTSEEIQIKRTPREVRHNEGKTGTGVKLTCQGTIGLTPDHPFHVPTASLSLQPSMSRQSSASGSTATGSSHGTAILSADRRSSVAESVSGVSSSEMDSEGGDGRGISEETEDGADDFTWPFEDAILRREPVFVSHLPLKLTSRLAGARQGGWEEPPRHAVVIPVFGGQASPLGLLVLGVNQRTDYDTLTQAFFNLVARHTAVGLFAVMTAEIDAKRAEELVRLDKAKTNFFNNVSHELRTPLTLVLGPLDDVLSNRELPAEAKQKLTVVQRHANRLLTMVNKLLDFSSLEGGRTQFTFRPSNIGSLTREIASLFRDAVERSGLSFYVDCDEDPPHASPVYLTADLWEKVIMNIVGNALKYSREGTISVTLRSTSAEAVLSVRDTGVGIPPEDLNKIFERFHRVEGSARTTSGTGIGLSLTLEIVSLLGGQLDVESEPGVGSNFIVRLPRGFTHLPIEQVSHDPETLSVVPGPVGRSLVAIEDAASWQHAPTLSTSSSFSMDVVMPSLQHRHSEFSSASSSTQSESASASASASAASGSGGSSEDFLDSTKLLNLKNRTILVADDSPDLLAYISSILNKSFNVVAVADGEAALEYALTKRPSLLVTDQAMPGLNGNELVTALRNDPRTALLPIIMLSAQAGPEARAGALEQGCDDYLVKPFQARELLARVNVHLQLGLLRVELEKRVEERTSALIDSEARNRALASKFLTLSAVSPVGIMQTDQDGNILYTNPRWHEITGVAIEGDHSSWYNCLSDEYAPQMAEMWRAAVSAGPSASAMLDRLEVKFKDGTWGQFEIRPFRDVGDRDGFVGVVTDTTRAKEIEALHIASVEQRAMDAEENRRQTEMFLDMSSHELRNPLSGVWQNAEVIGVSLEGISSLLDDIHAGKPLDRRLLDTARREMRENAESVESIILCASHQGRIADDILNVSKLNMGLLTLTPVPFELTAKMSEVMRMFEVECQQKRIALRLAVGESISALGAAWVTADASRLSQILLNFLSNAIKYTSDSIRRSIVIQLDAYAHPPPQRPDAHRVSQPDKLDLDPGSVWLVVGCQDSGKGLSQEELNRLFARFSQANPKSDQYGGSGLGLYVSKKLVSLHHGFIEVSSTVGVGSVFRFAIPVALAAPPSETARSPSASSASSLSMMVPQVRSAKRPAPRPPLNRTASKNAKTDTPEGTTLPPRLLVVEDNLVNQKVITRQLKLAGYSVTVANHGQEALDIILAQSANTSDPERIRMILMDCEMPVMGGLECVARLRVLEKEGRIPRYQICAVTGNARAAQIEQCLEAGFDSVAIKPYRIAELLATIATVVQPLAT